MTEKTKKTLNPTPAAAWKVIEPEAVKLPSGNVALLKKPNMYVLFKSGQIAEEFRKMMEIEDASEIPFEEKQRYIEYQITLTFVSPRVYLDVEDAQDGWLHIDQIEDEDKEAVLKFVGGEKLEEEEKK